jgi:hypothetical protein
MRTRGYVTISETRQALRAIYREDEETNLQKALLRAFADDLKPLDARGRWRPSSLLVLVGVLIFAILGVFAYFSLGGRR